MTGPPGRWTWLDLRLVPFALVLWAAAVVAPWLDPGELLVAGVLAATVGAALIRRPHRWAAVVAGVLAGLAVAGIGGGARGLVREASPLRPIAEAGRTVRGGPRAGWRSAPARRPGARPGRGRCHGERGRRRRPTAPGGRRRPVVRARRGMGGPASRSARARTRQSHPAAGRGSARRRPGGSWSADAARRTWPGPASRGGDAGRSGRVRRTRAGAPPGRSAAGPGGRRHPRHGPGPDRGVPPRGPRPPHRRVRRQRRDRSRVRALAVAPARRRPADPGRRRGPGARRLRRARPPEPERRPRRRDGGGRAARVGHRAVARGRSRAGRGRERAPRSRSRAGRRSRLRAVRRRDGRHRAARPGLVTATPGPRVLAGPRRRAGRQRSGGAGHRAAGGRARRHRQPGVPARRTCWPHRPSRPRRCWGWRRRSSRRCRQRPPTHSCGSRAGRPTGWWGWRPRPPHSRTGQPVGRREPAARRCSPACYCSGAGPCGAIRGSGRSPSPRWSGWSSSAGPCGRRSVAGRRRTPSPSSATSGRATPSSCPPGTGPGSSSTRVPTSVRSTGAWTGWASRRYPWSSSPTSTPTTSAVWPGHWRDGRSAWWPQARSRRPTTGWPASPRWSTGLVASG